MTELNLPKYNFRSRINKNGKQEIYDEIRKKYIVLTPEENVRQHFIQFLVLHKNFPKSLMGIEIGLKVNGLPKRADIVQYDKMGKPIIIVECKAPHIKIDQETFSQAAMYNMKMKVDYLIMTNGINHYCCKIDYNTHSIQYLKDIPCFSEL